MATTAPREMTMAPNTPKKTAFDQATQIPRVPSTAINPRIVITRFIIVMPFISIQVRAFHTQQHVGRSEERDRPSLSISITWKIDVKAVACSSLGSRMRSFSFVSLACVLRDFVCLNATGADQWANAFRSADLECAEKRMSAVMAKYRSLRALQSLPGQALRPCLRRY